MTNALDVAGLAHSIVERAGVVDAVGGALALGWYAEPRGTADVDLNVLVAHEQAAHVVDLFIPAGYLPLMSPERWIPPSAGVPLTREGSPVRIDLFFTMSDAYDEILARRVWYPVGQGELPFLSAEDLALFKVLFNRLQDWADLQAMCRGRSISDVDYLERKAVELRGPTVWPRLVRLRRMITEPG